MASTGQSGDGADRVEPVVVDTIPGRGATRSRAAAARADGGGPVDPRTEGGEGRSAARARARVIAGPSPSAVPIETTAAPLPRAVDLEIPARPAARVPDTSEVVWAAVAPTRDEPTGLIEVIPADPVAAPAPTAVTRPAARSFLMPEVGAAPAVVPATPQALVVAPPMPVVVPVVVPSAPVEPVNYPVIPLVAGPPPGPPPVKPRRKERPRMVRLPRRPRVRKVSRVVRAIDAWSVFKVSVVFYLAMYVVFLVAGVLLWNVAYSTGTIDNISSFFESFGWKSFEFKGGDIYHDAWIIGLFVVAALTGLNVVLATLYNLITDLVGGIRLTVLEEEVLVRPAGSNPPSPNGPGPVRGNSTTTIAAPARSRRRSRRQAG